MAERSYGDASIVGDSLSCAFGNNATDDRGEDGNSLKRKYNSGEEDFTFVQLTKLRKEDQDTSGIIQRNITSEEDCSELQREEDRTTTGGISESDYRDAQSEDLRSEDEECESSPSVQSPSPSAEYVLTPWTRMQLTQGRGDRVDIDVLIEFSTIAHQLNQERGDQFDIDLLREFSTIMHADTSNGDEDGSSSTFDNESAVLSYEVVAVGSILMETQCSSQEKGFKSASGEGSECGGSGGNVEGNKSEESCCSQMELDDTHLVTTARVSGATPANSFTDNLTPDTDTNVKDVVDTGSTSILSDLDSVSSSSRLQFFVRTINDGTCLVLRACAGDTVESVLLQLEKRTGIPLNHAQGLVYHGRMLNPELTLAAYHVENDSELQLVGRLRSTASSKSWELADDIVSMAYQLLLRTDDGHERRRKLLPVFMKEYLKMFWTNGTDIIEHKKVFQYSGAPLALCKLYTSALIDNKVCAQECIQVLISGDVESAPKDASAHYVTILLDLCKRLSSMANGSSLYASCRRALGLSLELSGNALANDYFDDTESRIIASELRNFVTELSAKVESSLRTWPLESHSLAYDIRELVSFLIPWRRAVTDSIRTLTPIPVAYHLWHNIEEINRSYQFLMDISARLTTPLIGIEGVLSSKALAESKRFSNECSQFLSLMGEFSNLIELFEGEKEQFYLVLKSLRPTINFLVQNVKLGDDHLWILDYKDVLSFESTHHLLITMFPVVDEDQSDDPYEMLLDRSKLLEVSFEYIVKAKPSDLQLELLVGFKDEEATGPGVVREWFNLVCEELFDPRLPLFKSCPSDCRRFFPNPDSGVEPMHLKFFMFCGRVIAMALMHKVQVNALFARTFLLNLAGKPIFLEDMKDEDPELYRSWKQILDMDAEALDSDALALSFIDEYDELGSRKTVELCPWGRNITVNSRNRQEYVNLLIEHRFSKRVAKQVAYFAQGFGDILNSRSLTSKFFDISAEQHLDLMLHGDDKDISVDDWKRHTEYHEYKESDCQISWFWKILEGMSAEQHRMLLNFWTSLRHLPAKGFMGLPSKLHIHKQFCSFDRLPSSHTCFYQLMLPPYTTFSTMKDRLHFICQKHITSSFGMP